MFADYPGVGRANDQFAVSNEVPWQSEARAGFQERSPSEFTVLGQYKQVSANRIISMKDGAGFVFDKPGQYSLTAEFSMGPAGRGPLALAVSVRSL